MIRPNAAALTDAGAVQRAWWVQMADTSHALSRFTAVTSIHLIQPDPHFVCVATIATLPRTLRELAITVYTPVKVLHSVWPVSGAAAEVACGTCLRRLRSWSREGVGRSKGPGLDGLVGVRD